MKLNELFNDRNRRKDVKTLGRGCGSGSGKTSGRGHKGQKSRSGHHLKSFSGGQTPIARRLPKRGGCKYGLQEKRRSIILNFDVLQSAIDAGKLAIDRLIVYDDLVSARCVSIGDIRKKMQHGKKYCLVLLSDGDLTSRIQISVDRASQAAKEKIESLGGKVICRGETSYLVDA